MENLPLTSCSFFQLFDPYIHGHGHTPRLIVKEPRRREGVYIFGVGGRVFSPKRPEIRLLWVFLLQFFRGGYLTFGSRGGGKSFPLKALGGSDYLPTPPMPTYDPRCFGYAVVEGLLSWNNIWAALWHAVSLYLAILILLSTIMLSTPILFSYFDYFSMKSEIKICDSHISVFLPLWTFLPFFMQKLLRALFVGSTKMNITLSCALLWAIHARLFDCGAR